MKKFTIIFIGIIVLSCQDIENCGTDNNQDFMVVRFFDLETKNSKKVGFVITAENSAEIFPPSSDSTFVGLPLNPNDPATVFFFDSETSHFELEMSYEKKEVSIFDPKCDPSYVYTGLDTVRYTFDSLSILGKVTSKQLSTNVEVYF